MNRDDWDARYAATGLVWSAEPNRFLVGEVDDLPAGRALDLACGEGRNAIWLASRGWDVVAVDFSAVAIDKGRAIAAERAVEVDWVVADVTEYEPQARHFDLALLAYLQLPGRQLATVLARAAASLAPGGVLVVVGHDITNITDGYGGPQDPSVLYGPDDVTARLGDVVVERAERVRRPVQTPDGATDAIDVLVRARRP